MQNDGIRRENDLSVRFLALKIFLAKPVAQANEALIAASAPVKVRVSLSQEKRAVDQEIGHAERWLKLVRDAKFFAFAKRVSKIGVLGMTDKTLAENFQCLLHAAAQISESGDALLGGFLAPDFEPAGFGTTIVTR